MLDSGASFDTECSDVALGFLPPVSIDLLIEYGLNLQAVDEQGRNALHFLLAAEMPPVMMPPIEGLKYLIQTGVPLNAPDAEGKTPLAYWRESRSYDTFELKRWLWSAVFGEPGYLQKARKQRTEITEMLAAAGATL